MDDFHELLGAFTDLARAGAAQFRSGWLLAQLAILVAAALVAAAAAAVTRRRLDLITITFGWPWPLRLAARVLVANLRILILMVLAAIAAFALSRMPLPSQYYLLRAVASLAAAWLVINLLAGFIRNQFVLRLVTFAAWAIAALAILDWLDSVTTALDSLFVMVGSVRLSALLALKTLAFLLFGIWAAIAVSDFIERRLSSEADLTPSIQVLIGKLARVALITVAILIVISSVGIDISALALFSGAVGVGVGFGLQKVVSNLVSGIILLADKSIKPGDVISVGDSFGWVTTMGARYTSVITRDGREHLIPNEDLITHRVLNWSHFSDNVRLDVNFSVGATCNPHVVRGLAVQAAASVPRVIEDPAPVCHLTGFGPQSTLDFILRFWIDDPVEGVTNIRGLVLLALWDALTRAGIEIPHYVSDMRMREPVRVVMQPHDKQPGDAHEQGRGAPTGPT
jgi:small-conductance mechanosensitive channel